MLNDKLQFINVCIYKSILLKVLNIELFPVHSQLLRESLLVSFPPVINMLKFTGLPCLIEIKLYIICVFIHIYIFFIFILILLYVSHA